jgi:hypothetical protein
MDKNIVVALSALKTAKKLSHRTGSDMDNGVVIAQQEQFAYQRYQRALQEIQNGLRRSGDSKTAIIACILVVCFETLCGNLAAAQSHAISGQKLLDQWIDQHPYKEIDKARILSPAAHLIEDEVFRAGWVLESHSRSFSWTYFPLSVVWE